MATQNDKKIICEIYVLVLLTCNIFIIIIPRTNLLGLPFYLLYLKWTCPSFLLWTVPLILGFVTKTLLTESV